MRKEIKDAKAKHGLNSKIWIRLIGLSFFRDQNVKKKKRKRNERPKRKEEEEEEEEKKKRREEEGKRKKVWNLTLSMEF